MSLSEKRVYTLIEACPGRVEREALAVLVGALLIVLSACSGPSGPGALNEEPCRAVYASIEAAARAALGQIHDTTRPASRARLRIGTIRRVEHGYVWQRPRSSRPQRFSRRAPTVRFHMRRDDVASYVIHPRTGQPHLDRAYEEPTESERRLVQRLDPFGRPLYLLTPTGRILLLEPGAPDPRVTSASVRPARATTTCPNAVADRDR